MLILIFVHDSRLDPVVASSFDKMFPKRRCYPGFKHTPAHILSAEEMAKWMDFQKIVFGTKR